LEHPAPLLRPALPERVGHLPGFREPATGADLSRDGRYLAVCSYDVTRVYERGKPGGWVLVGTVRYHKDGIEAICWDGPGADLIIAGEDRGVFRIAETTWRRGRD